MEKKYLAEGVWEIENFFDSEKNKKLHSLCLDNEGWDQLDYANAFTNNLKVIDGTKDIIQELNNLIETVFDESKYSLQKVFIISRFVTQDEGASSSMHIHVDRHDNPGSKDVVFGVIYYINDNYDGGEIFYPDLNLRHKPKANSLLCHDATIRHGVDLVTNGTRYMIPEFVFEGKDYFNQERYR
jgi:hypothetical protein